jgi:hypothetical protein
MGFFECWGQRLNLPCCALQYPDITLAVFHGPRRLACYTAEGVRFDKVASSSYFIDMRAVGLKTLKNKLSEYVRLAANGETVLVTDRIGS